MNLGSKIVELRKNNKMSQEAFAELFHVTRQTISNWENSKSYPDISTLVKISDTFNVSLDVLLKEDQVLVSTMDKKIKDYRKLKIILCVICSIVIVGGIIYGIDYMNFSKKYDAVKKEIETNYYKALDDNHFEKNGRLYTLQVSDDVKFVAGSQEMPMKKDRVLHFYAQFLYADIDTGDSTIEIMFNDFQDYYISKTLKDEEATIIFDTDQLQEKDQKNLDIISQKLDYNKEKLEEIIKQGYQIYDELYSSELAE